MAASSNGTNNSFSNTPQGKDDAFVNSALTEDTSGVFVFDVMANDAGGKAKSLYSVDSGSNENRLLTRDVARSEANTADISALGAKIWITDDGKIGYRLTEAVSQQLQTLGAGDALTDSFTYAIQLGNGTLSWATATVRVEGINDVAVLGGVTTGAVAEDSAPTLTVGGQLSIADADHGQSIFVAQSAVAGIYGSFGIDVAGNWTYSADNTQAAIQQLAAGHSLTESFTVSSFDGSASQAVTVVINGVNDIALIGGTTSADVTEDGVAMTGGVLSVVDADLDQAAFTAQAGVAGTYGSFSIDTAGNWTYSADNSLTEIQQLGVGQSLTDSFNVTSLDGSDSEIVTITLNGSNDAAVIGAPSVASVTEDLDIANGNLVAVGTVSIADADAGQAQFQTVVMPAAGTLGTLTLAANGSYTYSVANSAVQDLGDNESKVDTFTITSVDGTAKDIGFTIHGVNEAARVQPRILFVDDDGGVTSNVTWTTTLQSLGYIFDVQTLVGNGNPTNLQNYDVVIWSVSDRAYSNLTSQNVSTLTTYLNGGGDLIYAGGHNLYDEPAAASFIQNYLGLSNYQYNMPSVNGQAHLHASGPGGSYTLSDFSDNPGFTSVYGGTMMSAFNASAPTAHMLMEITSGGAHTGHSGYASFDSTNNDLAAINDKGTYRAATLGFDLNQLDPQYRAAFLDQIVQLVGGSPWDTVFPL